MLKYSVNIIWSDEDEAFLATIPEFPGLSAFGDTHEEAIQEALLAAQGMIEVLREDNEKIPEPKRKNKRNNHPLSKESIISF
jgi:predicted RNase H-like HicB family nuclease